MLKQRNSDLKLQRRNSRSNNGIKHIIKRPIFLERVIRKNSRLKIHKEFQNTKYHIKR